MTNPNRSIDRTHLSADLTAERLIIHRDVIAHCLRWTHVAKYLHQNSRYKDSHILDVGCGREQPLAKMLYSNRLIPSNGSYTGVDYNKLTLDPILEPAAKKFPINLIGGAIFPDVELPREKFDIITCFEVLEHVLPLGAFKILEGIHKSLDENGTAFISTPNFDPQVGAAANHINEQLYTTTEWMLQTAGFEIEDRFGTFASIKDYKEMVDKDDLDVVFNRLRAYYDSNYLATIFAPLYPHRARNVLWRVKRQNSQSLLEPMSINNLPKPWSSSDQWEPLISYLGAK